MRIVILDNHGQFTHLEQRALRELAVDTEIVSNTTPPGDVEADGVVLSGGPSLERTGRCSDYLDVEVPVLGICLGMQVIADALGGVVAAGEYGGYADVTVEITDVDDSLVGSLAPETRVWASHADEVTQLPPGFNCTASSDICAIEAMSNPEADLYGVQWHPEVAHTEAGEVVFDNFLTICHEATQQ